MHYRCCDWLLLAYQQSYLQYTTWLPGEHECLKSLCGQDSTYIWKRDWKLYVWSIWIIPSSSLLVQLSFKRLKNYLLINRLIHNYISISLLHLCFSACLSFPWSFFTFCVFKGFIFYCYLYCFLRFLLSLVVCPSMSLTDPLAISLFS